ncbi:hypothetical protein ACFPK1_09685 [Actinomycetospora rhizophila]|uniref:Tetratricopeptide repeat protein n=1 Tax=Actinomycetospora rhizophila TaxID=1416876 RepID=A0ABV9ZCN9_9PSEU
MTTDRQDVASPEFYLDQALAAFERARELTDVDEHPATYGVVLHDIALVHESSGRVSEAADLYRRSAAAKRIGSAPDDLQITLSALATCLIDAGEVGEAHTVADEALELLGRPGLDLDRSRRADRAYRLGLLYERLGEHGARGADRQALETFEWALSLLDEQASPGYCGRILRAVARMQVLLGRVHDASASLTEAVRFLERDGDAMVLVSGLIDLGRVYQRLADESMVPPVVPAPRAPEPATDAEPEADAEPEPEVEAEDPPEAASTDGPGWVAGSDGIARAEPAGA